MDPLSIRLACAYAMDWAFGDPRWFPHPVRWLGWAIERGERLARAALRNEKAGGALLALAIGGGTWAATAGALQAAERVSAGLAALMETVLLYFCLSTKDLGAQSWPVYNALKAGDLPAARAKVSMIVGRDTQKLDEPEVARATLETIGESAMDGIVAPLFYAVIGGAPLACLYKAVNTLDSMVGYRSARYLRFGSIPAALDRWMNKIPAWITAFLIAAGGRCLGFSFREGLRPLKDRRVRQENSYIAEAAMGGTLRVPLGGTNYYQGQPAETPPMGPAIRPLNKDRIPESIRVMYAASALAIASALAARFLFFLWVR